MCGDQKFSGSIDILAGELKPCEERSLQLPDGSQATPAPAKTAGNSKARGTCLRQTGSGRDDRNGRLLKRRKSTEPRVIKPMPPSAIHFPEF